MVHKLGKLSDYSVIFFNLINISGLNTLLGREESVKRIKAAIEKLEG